MADPFKQGLDMVRARIPALDKRPGNRRPGSITAIDVDGETVRVVQAAVRGSGGAITDVAEAVLELPAGADRSDAAVFGRAVAGALGRLRARPGAVVMGVPRAQVLLRTLIVPLIHNVRELASVVHLQTARDLPFRMDEAVLDFKVLRQVTVPARPESAGAPDSPAGESKAVSAEPLSKLEVLVAVAKREVVGFYQEAAKEAGLKLAGLGWLSPANARCVEACRAVEADQAVALVSLRSDEVGIDVIGHHSLLFSRGATVKAPSESAEAEAGQAGVEFAEMVSIEVVRSLHSYGGMEPHIPVTKILVAGATGQEQAVVEVLTRRHGLPCSALDLAESLDLPKASRGAAPGAVSALGLALGALDPRGLDFDFLNPKRPAVQRDMRRIRLLGGIAATAAVLVALLGIRTLLVNKRLNTHRALQVELAAAEKHRPIFRRMQQQAATVKSWTGEGRNWLDHYAYLSAVLPRSEEIYLSSLAFGSAGTIRFAVQARNGEVFAKLDKQLRAAGYEVKPLAITPGTDRHGYNFRSTVELVVPAKMKYDLTKVRPPARPVDDASLESRSKSKVKKP